jgi:hypothetical protein
MCSIPSILDWRKAIHSTTARLPATATRSGRISFSMPLLESVGTRSMANQRLWLTASAFLLAAALAAQKPPTTEQDKLKQSLNLPKDPPLVALGETSRLVFNVSPLSGRGLLSQQTRDALKAIHKLNGNAQIIHIRAFSAGNGDIRRIPQIISDALGDKRGQLPSISVLQVGALTLNDAQVVLETVSLGKKDLNKDGLTFYPAQTVVAKQTAADPVTPLKDLLQKSMDQLAANMQSKPALSVTCFVSDLDEAADLQRILTVRFPGAATNLVQPRRLAWETEASCEGVARGGAPTPRMAFTGTQVAFGTEEKDAAVAVQRLDRALVDAGAPRTGNATLVRFYLLSPAISTNAMKQLSGPAPAVSLAVEGVGPASAGFALDAIAPVR